VLDELQERGERLAVSRVELDVVACRASAVEPDRLAHHEADGFSHGLADDLGRLGRSFSAMKQLMRDLMGENRELVSR
jgi:hypothetical protein